MDKKFTVVRAEQNLWSDLIRCRPFRSAGFLETIFTLCLKISFFAVILVYGSEIEKCFLKTYFWQMGPDRLGKCRREEACGKLHFDRGLASRWQASLEPLWLHFTLLCINIVCVVKHMPWLYGESVCLAVGTKLVTPSETDKCHFWRILDDLSSRSGVREALEISYCNWFSPCVWSCFGLSLILNFYRLFYREVDLKTGGQS